MLIKFIVEKGCSKSIKYVWKKTGKGEETCIRRYYCADYNPAKPCSSKEEGTTQKAKQPDSNNEPTNSPEEAYNQKLKERQEKFRTVKNSLDKKLRDGLKNKELSDKDRKKLVVEYTKNLSDLASLVAFANSYDLEVATQGEEEEKEYNEICKRVAEFFDDPSKITDADSLEEFKNETRSFLLSLVSRDLQNPKEKTFTDENLAKLAEGYGSHFGTKEIGKSLNYTLRACNEFAYDSIKSMLAQENSILDADIKELVSEATLDYAAVIYESQIYHESVSKLDEASRDILIESAISASDKVGSFLMQHIDNFDTKEGVDDLLQKILGEKEGVNEQEQLAIKELKQGQSLA